jgi:2'-5' RNA ligase
MARVRLGVALLLEEPWRSEVDGLRRALGSPALHSIPPHVTLVPPVNVRVDDLQAVLDSVRQVAAHTKPFSVKLGPVSTFAPLTPVLKLDVQDAGDIAALRKRVATGVLDRPAQWPFVPHVTLHDEASDAMIEHAMASLVAFDAETIFRAVAVLRQDTDRVWRPMFDAFFAPPTTIGAGGIAVAIAESTLLEPGVCERLGFSEAEYAFALTARINDEFVGALIAQVNTGFRLQGLQVVEEFRGMGVGSHLVRQARFRAGQIFGNRG